MNHVRTSLPISTCPPIQMYVIQFMHVMHVCAPLASCLARTLHAGHLVHSVTQHGACGLPHHRHFCILQSFTRRLALRPRPGAHHGRTAGAGVLTPAGRAPASFFFFLRRSARAVTTPGKRLERNFTNYKIVRTSGPSWAGMRPFRSSHTVTCDDGIYTPS